MELKNSLSHFSPNRRDVSVGAGEEKLPTESSEALKTPEPKYKAHCSNSQEETRTRTVEGVYIPTPVLPDVSSFQAASDENPFVGPFSSFFLSCHEVLEITEKKPDSEQSERSPEFFRLRSSSYAVNEANSAFRPVQSLKSEVSKLPRQIGSNASLPETAAEKTGKTTLFSERKNHGGKYLISKTRKFQPHCKAMPKPNGEESCELRQRATLDLDIAKEGCQFKCNICHKEFHTAQALGGHMSRTHAGKSGNYNRKQEVRKQREIERLRLLLAKRKYFFTLNIDYDKAVKSSKGKARIRGLINRSRIKRLKRQITDEEVESFL